MLTGLLWVCVTPILHHQCGNNRERIAGANEREGPLVPGETAHALSALHSNRTTCMPKVGIRGGGRSVPNTGDFGRPLDYGAECVVDNNGSLPVKQVSEGMRAIAGAYIADKTYAKETVVRPSSDTNKLGWATTA